MESLHAYIALICGYFFGRKIFHPIEQYILTLVLPWAISLRPSSFNAAYDIFEENYDYFTSRFRVNIKHYKYIEAMRAFELESRSTIKGNFREATIYIAEYTLQFWFLLLFLSLLFMPSTLFFLSGVLLAPFVRTITQAISMKRSGEYLDLLMYGIVDAAYKYTFSRGLPLKASRKAKAPA